MLTTILQVTFCVYRRLPKFFLQPDRVCWTSLLSRGSLLDLSVGPGPGKPKSPTDALGLSEISNKLPLIH